MRKATAALLRSMVKGEARRRGIDNWRPIYRRVKRAYTNTPRNQRHLFFPNVEPTKVEDLEQDKLAAIAMQQ